MTTKTIAELTDDTTGDDFSDAMQFATWVARQEADLGHYEAVAKQKAANELLSTLIRERLVLVQTKAVRTPEGRFVADRIDEQIEAVKYDRETYKRIANRTQPGGRWTNSNPINPGRYA